MKIFLLHPATFKLDGGAMFGIIPKPLWSKKISPDQLNRIEMSLRVVLIELEERKILIDTGIGDYHSDKFNQQFAISSTKSPLTQILLSHLKLNPEEITDIILTHLHFDHVGGLGTIRNEQRQLLFPNATIHVHKKHYEYALNPTQRDKGSFQDHFFAPLLNDYANKGQLNLIEKTEGTLIKTKDETIDFKVSFGHTPYMIHPIFKNYIYMADLVPMSHHVKIPWVMGYDIEPGITTQYKEKFYKYIMQNNLKMIFEHDSLTWGGRLKINEKEQFELTDPYQSKQESIQQLE
ncbi:MAG: MBL fold metallo-hydrolase [Bacteriovoracaceae bacterium]|jgi:glyoxylase-like metal-dependent hydrolase (beta-lactamase superfamily II)|nr:MBL fold metallo-hydrolase [Halobacteriovoraceae bacterium]MDP7321652.1 MBL fold metallo-hydrolase [Bacteriovoracaceae bacterium]